MALEDRDWYRDESGQEFWRQLDRSIRPARPTRPQVPAIPDAARAEGMVKAGRTRLTEPLGRSDILVALVAALVVALVLIHRDFGLANLLP